jgi:YVTN family beta-propeller protein
MAARLTEPFAPGADSLDLTLTATGDPRVADVAAYDPSFAQHRARFEHQPNPLYLLVITADVALDTQVTLDSGPPAHSVVVNVAGGTFAGASFVIPRDATAAGARLLHVHVSSGSVGAGAADLVGISVLLGTTARLLWVMGWERDQLRGHLANVVAQRHIPRATGRSLDYIGSDLRIARFPPLPYPYDSDTVALYHLDDTPDAGQPEVDNVEDIVARYQSPGHAGTNISRLAQSGVPGRFGRAFAFRDPNAEIRIPFATGMSLGPTDSLTVECFVKPDAGAADGHVLARHPDPANPAQAGWALSVGTFGRGISSNVRFLVSDGTRSVVLFADMSLTADRFHHLAGVVDRAHQVLMLYVDGVNVATQPTGSLGSIATAVAEPFRIGRAGSAAFQGLVDEVRLSGVARQTFHPVLGEDDEVYRRRLAIFRHWNLPTPANLESTLNAVAGPIAGQSNGIVVNDTNSTLTVGDLALSINPVLLLPGESISATGDRQATENDASGAPDDTTFDIDFLVTNTDARLTFAPPPSRTLARGELPPDAHKMQVVVKRGLAQLLGSIQAGLRVESGFDPRAADLRRVGRAVVLSHSALDPGTLAASAHVAGFDFVALRADGVYASCRAGDYLDIVATALTATAIHSFDGLSGQTLTLTVDPPFPKGTDYRWSTIPCGAGRGCFVTTTGMVTTCEAEATSPSVTLRLTSPGPLAVKVESSLHGLNAAGNRTLQVGIDQLADHSTIGADGSLGVAESVAGALQPDDFFDPAYLVAHNASVGVDYGTDVNHHRMQNTVADRLDELVTLLRGVNGNLQVLSAYTPGAADLTRVGRGLTLSHQTLAGGPLAALAFAAGFTFVHREGGQVFVRQAAGELLKIVGPTAIGEGSDTPQPLRVSPRANPQGVALGPSSVFVANAGSDTLTELDPVSGQVRRTFKVGWSPVAAVVNPTGSRAYTADALGNTVSVIDLTAGSIAATIPVGATPSSLAHHPTLPRLYVACRDANSVQVIDTGALSVTTTLTVASAPRSLALRPDGAEVWIARDTADRLDLAPTAAFTAANVNTITLAGGPTSIAFLPDSSRAYVTLRRAARLALVTTATHAVSSTPAVGTAPAAVAIAPDGLTLFVTDQSIASPPTPEVLMLNADGTMRASVHVQDPGTLAVSATTAYVASGTGNAIHVIDIAERGIANTFQLGSGLGERLSWVVRLGPSAQASLSSTTAPQVTVHADRAGQVIVLAVYTLTDHNAPYTFTVQLNPNLIQARPDVVIPKDQYDLIMNILNTLRPAGVEVITRPIRERVIEVRTGLLNAFPDYTYPNYRVRGPTLRRPTNGG